MSSGQQRDGIVILGHPRSGTTLLRRLLDSHSQISCPGETHILSACARFLQAEATGHGVDIGVLAGLSYAGFPDADVIERLRDFAFSFPREYAQKAGKTRWAEKTAFDAYYIEEIEKLCGDQAYFVGIVRHGLDVALSCNDFVAHAGSYIGGLHSYIQKYPQPLLAFAHSWVDVNRRLFSFGERHNDNCIIVRYEDLIEDPDSTLAAILEFVGESYEPEIIKAGLNSKTGLGFSDHKTIEKSKIENTSMGRWHELSADQLRDLGAIVNPLLEICDYDPIDLKGSNTQEEARRKYEMSLVVRAARAGNDDS